jgi:hypothetical protein
MTHCNDWDIFQTEHPNIHVMLLTQVLKTAPLLAGIAVAAPTTSAASISQVCGDLTLLIRKQANA